MAAVYLHYDAAECSLTMKAKTDAPLDDALTKFCAKFAKKHPTAAPLEALEARHEGLVLAASSWASLKAKSDVFVTRCAPKPKPKPAPTPAPAPPPPPPKPAAAPKPPPAAAPEKPKPSAQEQEATQLVKKLLKRADTQRAGKALKTAKHLYEAILEAAPGSRDAARGLAAIALARGDHKGAATQFADLFAASKERRDAYALGRCHAYLGRWTEAQKAFRRALAARDAANAVAEADVVVALARVLLAEGDVDEACELTEKVLGADQQHVGAACCYAAIAREMGKLDDELSLLLRAVVADQNDRDARHALARALGEPRGVERLRRQLGAKGESAAAVAFLATIAKDHGYVEVAVELLAWAWGERPSSASYALNLVDARGRVESSSRLQSESVAAARLPELDERAKTASIRSSE